MNHQQRILSPREQTHLVRFGKGQLAHFSKVGTTAQNITDFGEIADYGEMPVEYMTGCAEFYGRVFKVDKNVLIPRLETEGLVDLVLAEIKKMERKKSLGLSSSRSQKVAPSPLLLADVGCGSGAIGLTLGWELEKLGIKAEVWLSDVSEKVIAVAQKNAIPKTNFKFLISDLLQNYPAQKKFNILVANLPYIPEQRVSFLDPSVKDFEPHLALSGGENGLHLIYQFLTKAPCHLVPHGLVFLEIDHTHTLQDFLKYKKYFTVKLIQDEFGQNRFVRLELRDCKLAGN